jgi:hypothetical protein
MRKGKESFTEVILRKFAKSKSRDRLNYVQVVEIDRKFLLVEFPHYNCFWRQNKKSKQTLQQPYFFYDLFAYPYTTALPLRKNFLEVTICNFLLYLENPTISEAFPIDIRPAL